MATDTTHDTRTANIDVDGRHDQPKADRNGDHHEQKDDQAHGHDGPQMDLEPIGTGKVILFAVVFIVLFALLFVLGYWPVIRQRNLANADANAAADTRPVVDIAKPHAPTKLPALELPATAEAFQATSMFPRASGYLTQRLVDIGDHVWAGQLLAVISTPEVDAQLASAQANLQQANAAAQRSKDDYDLASSTYDRYQGFAKTGGVTQQQLDERKSAFTQAKATLAGTQATARSDEAEVQRLTALVSYERIIAPFTGVITARNYDVGALMSATNTSPGTELYDIAETDVLRVFVNVPQSYSTQVKAGQPAEFVVPNYPGRMFEGKVARTSDSINQTTRTLRVEVDCPNEKGELYAGMYGNVHYEVPEMQKQLIIPSSALVFGPAGMQVAVVGDDNKVKFTKVALGRDLGVEVEVTQGLNPDDRVVSNPGERLSDGVEVQESKKPDIDNKPTVAGTAKPTSDREASAK